MTPIVSHREPSFQFVAPAPWGHVSVCMEPGADPVALGARVLAILARHAG